MAVVGAKNFSRIAGEASSAPSSKLESITTQRPGLMYDLVALLISPVNWFCFSSQAPASVSNMFDVFGSVKGLLKLDDVCIDNNIFRLHYKATVVFLVVSSLLVTSKQYIGDPIDCIVEGESER